jgi:hypothetical protein
MYAERQENPKISVKLIYKKKKYEDIRLYVEVCEGF